jgi:hypothetical protein
MSVAIEAATPLLLLMEEMGAGIIRPVGLLRDDANGV